MPLGVEVGLRPAGDFVLDGDLASPKGYSLFPNFWAMSIVVKRSPISAAAEPLYNGSPQKYFVGVSRITLSALLVVYTLLVFSVEAWTVVVSTLLSFCAQEEINNNNITFKFLAGR